ncbi:hypothetical protein ACTXLS_08830 [Corynebacterium variabile]|uniref:hypothetical protein n=1 Tax=Corynebacterium variabile TaxID=1727 RepID=UPI003FD2A3C7
MNKRKRIYTSDYLTYRLNHDTTMTDQERRSVMKHRLAVIRAEKHHKAREEAARQADINEACAARNYDPDAEAFAALIRDGERL